MTTLVLGYQSIEKKVKTIALPRIHRKSFFGVTIVFGLAMVVSYIFLVNQLTHGSYTIKQYEKQLAEISSYNRMLNEKVSGTDVLYGVAHQANVLGFEKTGRITYVQMFHASLAQASR